MFAALLMALVGAAPAAAQDPVPTPTPTPAPPPAAAAATLKIAVSGLRGARKRPIALRGDRLGIRGSLQPAAPGQRVIVRVYRHRRKLLERKVAVKPDGSFTARVRARPRGPLSIRAVHRASPQLLTARARSVTLAVVRPSLSFGARGPLVRLLQAKLAKLRYPAPRSGIYDAATGRAVMAFRKVNRFARVETADERVVRRALAGRGAWRVRYPRLGHHVEADLSQQVLSLVDGKRLVRTYPVSSGKPSTPTIVGRFRVYSKTPGTNGLGMVDASYFRGGYAIHGYISVPAFAASHGCLRVPIPNARAIYDWVRFGDTVVVDT